MVPLNTDPAKRRYRALIGTGGIGTGVFFALDGNHALGREESRSGRFLDHRDYCKLHIIAHYVRVLTDDGFAVLPIGKVGRDDAGKKLLHEMQAVGMDLRYIRTDMSRPTMHCTCLVYPDGTGGNLTLNDSASSAVDVQLVREAEASFADFAGSGIALAAPEVPMGARMEVLRLGTQYRFLRVASFTSSEIAALRESTLLRDVDLLAINLDEAAAVAGLSTGQPAWAIVESAVATLRRIQPAMCVSITAGRQGSWGWDGERLWHRPIIEVPVKGTAGAGDAHFAGLLVGLAAGLDLPGAQDLATLVAAMSVTSPHTLHQDIDAASLRSFAVEVGACLRPAVMDLLATRNDGGIGS
jgi:ribokinase